MDNHVSILFRIKIHAESKRKYCSCGPEDTDGMDRGQLVVHRLASKQEI